MPDEDVLDGVVEGVAHVERPGDVGRGDGDGVSRAARVHLGMESRAREPLRHQPLLHLVGRIARRQSSPLSRRLLSVLRAQSQQGMRKHLDKVLHVDDVEPFFQLRGELLHLRAGGRRQAPPSPPLRAGRPEVSL